MRAPQPAPPTALVADGDRAAAAVMVRRRAHALAPPRLPLPRPAPQSANALSFDELQGLTYLQVKGTGIANTCPTLDGGSSNVKDLKPGTYALGKFCMEPTSFTVKEESQVRGLARQRAGAARAAAGSAHARGGTSPCSRRIFPPPALHPRCSLPAVQGRRL